MDKTEYESLLIRIMRCVSGTYQLFIDTVKSLKGENKVEFLKFLQKSLTDEFINVEGFAYMEDLNHHYQFEKGSKYDVKDSGLQKGLLVKAKGDEILRIRKEIPTLLITLTSKNKQPGVPVFISDNHIVLSKNFTDQDSFIKELFRELSNKHLIGASEEEFVKHFCLQSSYKKIIINLSIPTVLYFFIQLKERNYLVEDFIWKTVYNHFLSKDGVEFNIYSLKTKESRINTIIKTKVPLPNFRKIKIIKNILDNLSKAFPPKSVNKGL